MPTIAPVLDMVLLDPVQPRGIAFQIARIEEHLAALPPLREDGMPESALLQAQSLRGTIAVLSAERITAPVLADLLRQTTELSQLIERSYFLHQEEGEAKATRVFLA